MNSFTVFLAFALVAVAVAEAPGGYNYNRPSGGSIGGGSIGGGSIGGGGGGYQSVPHGYTTSEGQNVDPALLEQIRQILLKEESQSGAGGHGGGFGGQAPSSSYGVPSSSYGVPSYQQRVVGIDLFGVKPALQVAQYSQQSLGQVSGGYPSGPANGGYPSGPSNGGYPSGRPSGSYGAPF